MSNKAVANGDSIADRDPSTLDTPDDDTLVSTKIERLPTGICTIKLGSDSPTIRRFRLRGEGGELVRDDIEVYSHCHGLITLSSQTDFDELRIPGYKPVWDQHLKDSQQATNNWIKDRAKLTQEDEQITFDVDRNHCIQLCKNGTVVEEPGSRAIYWQHKLGTQFGSKSQDTSK